MKVAIRLLPEARVEFDDAADWYEAQRPGLGLKFLTKIRTTFDQLAAHPQSHPTVYRDVRRAVVPKYPYVIIYREGPEEVVVISVFHTSRDPSTWKSRIGTPS